MIYALRKLIAFVFLGGMFWFIYQDLDNLDKPWFMHALGMLTVPYAIAMIVFFWICGCCTAVILWQAKRILDTILAGNPFQMVNAVSMGRAAGACWVISAVALIRFVAETVILWNPITFFTYNTLFIPCFFMAGLLFKVMGALFRQAAELQEDQDLTI